MAGEGRLANAGHQSSGKGWNMTFVDEKAAAAELWDVTIVDGGHNTGGDSWEHLPAHEYTGSDPQELAEAVLGAALAEAAALPDYAEGDVLSVAVEIGGVHEGYAVGEVSR